MTVSNELIDSLLADYKKPEDLIGENGLLKQLTKRLVERALQAEMNRPGYRGGQLVKVKHLSRSSLRVADSSLPQPRPVEYTKSAPAVGCG